MHGGIGYAAAEAGGAKAAAFAAQGDQLRVLALRAVQALVDRGTERFELLLLALETTEARADDFARVAVAARGDLGGDEVLEVVAQGDAGVLGHGKVLRESYNVTIMPFDGIAVLQARLPWITSFRKIC